ncbi:flagellin [Blastochloris viridis]|uniref:Flagellin n=1 Tax=Blastochloris viridis TaxID=1079 RepID=A0A0H5BC00_BLAVI|nr:flagellin [Blastochloris viridis]ALK08089.1 Flagellin [Blastochloris viridis]BAR98649.1 flagellin protein FlaA [Blastochloris viridis]CUU44011.1 Flagellin [Blastochloris viridis]
MPVITTNTAANSAVRYLNINSSDQSSSLSKIASGSRITKASDDAAGLAISTRISSDVVALEQAATNASHATAMLQTADGAASNISDILMRMKALATQASSATVTDTERSYINAEFTNLAEEITSVATGARYNNVSLLDGTGSFGAVMVGSNSSDTISLSFTDLDATALSLNATTISDQTTATAALTAITSAIGSVSAARASLGAQQSRFEFQADTIATSIENLSAANSAIEDVDVASEQAKLSSAEVKVQAAVAALASANQMPQALLKLLQ